MSLGIKGKWVIGYDGSEHRLIREGVVITEDKRIKHVGKSYSGEVERWIEVKSGLVIPGLINTHIHAATSPKDKSFIDDIGVRELYMSNLGENLAALGKSMRQKDFELYAKYSIAECLRSGNTTILEIGMVPNLGAEKTLEIIEELGIRAVEGDSIRDGVWNRTDAANFQTKWLEPEHGFKMLEEATEFVEEYDGSIGGRLIGALYPDTVDKVSFELQEAIREKANELSCPISIHAGQWVMEFQNMLRMYGRTPIEFLQDTGLLDSDLIIGHGWAISGHPLVAYPPVDGGDLEILAYSNATVSHDPLVFIKRGNKMHSHSRYLDAGINVSIGTDTAPQDMLNEMRMASYTSKLSDWDAYSGSSAEIFNSATLNAAKGLKRKDLGRLSPGSLADIVVVEMESLNNVPCRDPIRNLVNSASRSDVRYVIVNGDIVVDNGRLLTVDEDRLVKEVQEATLKIWDRIPENHFDGKTADEISPPSFKPWEP